jgi:uncharacterized protein (TIGR02099 family)
VRRIAAGVLGALLIAFALALGALRLFVAQVPEHAGRVRTWIEQQTHLRIEYRALDARLRWFGPEVVLQDVRLLDRDGSQALFATREASVGLDLWNFLRTGQFVAGRVRFDGPDITVVRLPDGRIRLLGQQERPADRPPFDLDRLPAGRVIIANAAVNYRDLMTGRGPWRIEDLQLTLRRDRDVVVASGSGRLPPRLGGKFEFAGDLQGSLDEFAKLKARVTLTVPRLLLAGWSELMPSGIAQPRAGEGSVEATVTVAWGTLTAARANVDLAGVRLELPAREPAPVETVVISAPYREPGRPALELPVVDRDIVQQPAIPLPREVQYSALKGDFRLRREGAEWVFRVSDLRTDSSLIARTAAASRLSGRFRGNPVTTFGLTLFASQLRLPDIWPLVLAYAPRSFDPWSGLDPAGEIRSLWLEVDRTRAGAFPKFKVSADVAGLGVRPVGRLPGLSGITAVLSGTDERGRVALRSTGVGFALPRLFPKPFELRRVTADADWRREGTALTIESGAAGIEHERARANGRFTLRLDRPGVSPFLDLEADVTDADARLTPDCIPYATMSPRTIAWFQSAFLGGRVTRGHLVYRGPTRYFPFRNGEGEFTARAEIAGMNLNYFDGFAPLEEGEGVVDFHNQGLQAHLRGGKVGGLRLERAEYSIDDYHAVVMKVDAAGSADLSKALTFLQASPLGPTIGRMFMSLSGSGPADFAVNLTFPSAEAAGVAPDHQVRARLKAVTINLPALRAPAQKVTGDFEMRNLEFRSTVHGTFLDGPFDLSVAPGAIGAGVTAAVDFRGRGQLAGAGLPAVIGLPSGIRMTGGAEWELTGRLEQRGEGEWPARFEASSSLAGLEILAPVPFAKGAPDPRPTRVRLEFPTTGETDIAAESGSARAKLRFVDGKDGRSQLERGAARFDGQAAVLPSRPGLQVAGEWPKFDLAEWLALGAGGGGGGGQQLSEWLGPVDVQLSRAVVAGFQFRDVDAHLRFANGTWQVAVAGPMAEGEVAVPDDLSHGAPIVLAMKRLQLETEPAAASDRAPPQTDPRTLPALTLTADDFSWEGRRFGQVQATISKDPQGLRFDSLASSAPSFGVSARGTWFMEGSVPRTRLGLEFTSNDLAAASRALGYRDVVEAKRATISASVSWDGEPSTDAIGRMDGTLRLALDQGQLRNVKPGAGRILGLTSVVALPRRLALDFHDVTDEGLAFDKVRGDFELRKGNAYTQNLLLKGAAVDVGVVGRTGLATEDYDQTVVVSGNPSGAITVASAFAAGPVVGAGVLVLSQLFKGQLQGLTRAYYHVTGPWADPVVEKISATEGESPPPGAKPDTGDKP